MMNEESHRGERGRREEERAMSVEKGEEERGEGKNKNRADV